MTWSREKRAYFFGCECSPQLTEAEKLTTGCLTGHQADGAFLERYCAPDRRPLRSGQRITGTQSRLHDVPIPVARCVISKLAELVPNADHGTPGWNWPQRLLPAVVIGHLGLGLKIGSPRCGLWAEGGDLYFWADRSAWPEGHLDLDGLAHPEGWEEYGKAAQPGGPLPMLRYSEPLSCICGGADNAVLPGPVVDFLQAFAETISPSECPDGPLAPRDVYAASGPDDDDPAPDQDDDARDEEPGHQDQDASRGSDRLSNSDDPKTSKSAKGSQSKSRKTGTTRRKTAQGVETKSDKPKKAKNPAPVSGFMGMVFEDAKGNYTIYVADRANFQANWRGHVNDAPWRVLFLCCGPDRDGVTAIVDQIREVKTHLSVGHLPRLPHPVGAPQGPVGSTYVYGYFDPAHPPATPGAWNDAFYIGVGTVGAGNGVWRGRWTKHVNDALAGEMLPRHQRIRRWLLAHPPGHLPANQHAVRSGLVRKLYAFTGGYADELKFFTEQFLISHGFGAHNFDNDTNGNAQTGLYIGISQPFIFTAGIQQHAFCWAELVTAFSIDPNAPRINNELVPALLTLVAASFVPQLNAALNAIGLHPVPHVAEGRLHPNAILYSHLNVTGAGDCMLSYQTEPLRYYRIDLRLSKSSPHLMINMRPGVAGNAAFTASIIGHVFVGEGLQNITINPGALLDHYAGIRAAHPENPNLPVKNANHWPFYKPMAHDANGRIAGWFPVGWPPGPNIAFPPVLVTLPNWLIPPGGAPGEAAHLSLDAALELILIGFP